MLSVAESFAPTYVQARRQFLEAAVIGGLVLESHSSPVLTPDGDAVAMDVALAGPRNATRLLVLTNAGCLAGSGVLAFALNDGDWRSRASAAGVAVLYVHAPWCTAANGWSVATMRAVLREQATYADAVHCIAIGRADEALQQAAEQACPRAACASLALDAANPPSAEPLHPDTWKGIAVSQSRQALFQALAELA
ncbi:MAG: DUF2817 domain-containing protein [Comamonas sp.]